MATKKQTKKENTIPENHRNPETLNRLYVNDGKNDAYLINIQGTHPEASGHGKQALLAG